MRRSVTAVVVPFCPETRRVVAGGTAAQKLVKQCLESADALGGKCLVGECGMVDVSFERALRVPSKNSEPF